METVVNERNPLRLLEELNPSGLGEGNLGVIVGRTGTGKSAFIVQFALDYLLRGSRVLHVGLDEPVQRIRIFYDELIHDMAAAGAFEDPLTAQFEIERKRHIHSYLGHSFTLEKLREAIRFLREHMHFSPNVIAIDGLKVEEISETDVKTLVALAAELQAEMWITVAAHRKEIEAAVDGIPSNAAAFAKHVTAVVELRGSDEGLHAVLHTEVGAGGRVIDAILDSASMQVAKRVE